MHFLDLTLSTLADNLAFDEALLLEAEAGHGGEVLRLWEWTTPAVVLGAGGIVATDVNESACATDGVPLARRSSGGGTVLLGSGCLLFSLVLSYDRSPMLREIQSSYRFILEHIRDAICDRVPDAVAAGTSDLAAAGLKFSGNAQQRKRAYVLHHGSLLYNFDVHQVERYLRLPTRQPDYRRGRPHADFLRNLPLSGAELRERLRQTWSAEHELTAWPRALVERLASEKYHRAEWLHRR
jgi:lipoate-protein ligase A